MKAVVQRVSSASVKVEGQPNGEIGTGFVVLLGVWQGDTEADCKWLAEKIASLRVFTDENDKLNLSLADVGGAVLVVPNFTIAGDCRKGARPSFIKAERPDAAIPLFELFKQTLRDKGLRVESGEFGTYMEVSLVNDGPITLLVEHGANE